jgi:hypothetical protein
MDLPAIGAALERYLDDGPLKIDNHAAEPALHTVALATVLILHDTIELNYHRDNIPAIGILDRLAVGGGIYMDGCRMKSFVEFKRIPICSRHDPVEMLQGDETLPRSRPALRLFSNPQSAMSCKTSAYFGSGFCYGPEMMSDECGRG